MYRRLLTESPDCYYEDFSDPNDEGISWNELHLRPITFGWYNNKLYTADAREYQQRGDNGEMIDGEPLSAFDASHISMVPVKEMLPRHRESEELERTDFKFPGRLWANTKVISFWSLPNDNELLSVLNQLSMKLKIEINPSNWRIDLQTDKLNTEENDGSYIWKLVPLSDYLSDKSPKKHMPIDKTKHTDDTDARNIKSGNYNNKEQWEKLKNKGYAKDRMATNEKLKTNFGLLVSENLNIYL